MVLVWTGFKVELKVSLIHQHRKQTQARKGSCTFPGQLQFPTTFRYIYIQVESKNLFLRTASCTCLKRRKWPINLVHAVFAAKQGRLKKKTKKQKKKKKTIVSLPYANAKFYVWSVKPRYAMTR